MEREKLHSSIPEKPVLPFIREGGLGDIFHVLERSGVPKNLDSLLSRWTDILKGKMKYDAINYAIFRELPLDEEQGGFIDKIDIAKLSMTPRQKEILRRTFLKAKKELRGDYLEGFVDTVLSALDKNIPSLIASLMESPTLRRFLLSDPDFNHEWHSLTIGKNVSQILELGIANCKSLSMTSKILIEGANIRYKLGIVRIEVIETDEFHVFLRLHTQRGSIDYDPTSIFYK